MRVVSSQANRSHENIKEGGMHRDTIDSEKDRKRKARIRELEQIISTSKVVDDNLPQYGDGNAKKEPGIKIGMCVEVSDGRETTLYQLVHPLRA